MEVRGRRSEGEKTDVGGRRSEVGGLGLYIRGLTLVRFCFFR